MPSPTVKTRLALLLGLLLALTGLSGALTLYRLHGLTAAADTVYRDRILPLVQLHAVADSYRIGIADAVRSHLNGALSRSDTLEAIDAQRDWIERQWAAYLATYLLERERSLIPEAESSMARADEVVRAARTAVERGNTAALRDLARYEMTDAFGSVGQVLDRLMEFQLQVAAQERERARQSFEEAAWVIGALAILAVGGGTFLALAVFLRYRAEGRAAERRNERLGRFFVALSRTNQLIVRERDEQVLFELICRICVDSGQVPFAAVVQTDGRVAQRVASAGIASEGWSASPPRWALDDPRMQALVATRAMLAQGPVIDAGEPMAAFAFQRAGRVHGALVLGADQGGFFDPELIALLDDMSRDISFALDNIDRERAHLAAEQAVQQHEQQLRAILESTREAIVAVDAQRCIVVFNRAASALFGVSVAQALGVTIDRYIHAAEGAADDWLSPSPERRRLEGVRAGGERFPVEVSMSRTGSAAQPLWTAVIRDLTEQLQAEQARRAQAEAEAASKAKTDFLSRMSHELRTPLNAVMGFSQLLRMQTQDRLTGPELTQLGHIHRAGQHLLALVDDVLDVARIESGRLNVELRPIALQPVLEDAVRITEPLAGHVGVELSWDAAAEAGWRVKADPNRLRQVLINLLSNAVKYNRPGGSVQIEVGAQDGQVCIEVTDTGVGMTEEQMAHLYEPFNRLGREHDAVEGAGIGLALSRQLVRLMDGDLEIRSEVGRGTRVTVTLPREFVAEPVPTNGTGSTDESVQTGSAG